MSEKESETKKNETLIPKTVFDPEKCAAQAVAELGYSERSLAPHFPSLETRYFPKRPYHIDPHLQQITLAAIQSLKQHPEILEQLEQQTKNIQAGWGMRVVELAKTHDLSRVVFQRGVFGLLEDKNQLDVFFTDKSSDNWVVLPSKDEKPILFVRFGPIKGRFYTIDLDSLHEKDPLKFEQIIDAYHLPTYVKTGLLKVERALNFHTTPENEILEPFMADLLLLEPDEIDKISTTLQLLLAYMSMGFGIDGIQQLKNELTQNNNQLENYLKHRGFCHGEPAQTQKKISKIYRTYLNIIDFVRSHRLPSYKKQLQLPEDVTQVLLQPLTYIEVGYEPERHLQGKAELEQFSEYINQLISLIKTKSEDITAFLQKRKDDQEAAERAKKDRETKIREEMKNSSGHEILDKIIKEEATLKKPKEPSFFLEHFFNDQSSSGQIFADLLNKFSTALFQSPLSSNDFDEYIIQVAQKLSSSSEVNLQTIDTIMARESAPIPDLKTVTSTNQDFYLKQILLILIAETAKAKLKQDSKIDLIFIKKRNQEDLQKLDQLIQEIKERSNQKIREINIVLTELEEREAAFKEFATTYAITQEEIDGLTQLSPTKAKDPDLVTKSSTDGNLYKFLFRILFLVKRKEIDINSPATRNFIKLLLPNKPDDFWEAVFKVIGKNQNTEDTEGATIIS